jgi:radical SAM superfamily enzyme YgiQ (UPF0313 family)
MKKVLLYNPPGGNWTRGEARCEANIDQAVAYTTTEPVSLCYLAEILRQNNIQVKILDCPIENIPQEKFLNIVADYKPDLAILNACILNLNNDIKIIKSLKKISPETKHYLVLPYYDSVPLSEISYSKYSDVDYFIVSEIEAFAFELAEFITGNIKETALKGIIAKNGAGKKFVKHPKLPALQDLNLLPLPARDLINNKLYTRPDTNRPMACIVDGRGCPAQCIFCLSAITTGKHSRTRSVASIIKELKICIKKYNIRDFLFRSDTFTQDRAWALDLCQKITEQKLNISWAVNSRTSSFDTELAINMRKAGCYLIQFGIESGSDRSLELQKKGTTTEQAIKAVNAARKANILAYGTILLGFPWETKKDILETNSFIKKLKLDFIEVQIVAPYKGTKLYKMARYGF